MQNYSKKNAELISQDTLYDVIEKCGLFMHEIDLENMIVLDKSVTVQLGAYNYRLLASSLSVDQLINALSSNCGNLVTLFLNTTTISAVHLGKLVHANRKLTKVKICGIHTNTLLYDYLQLLPDSIEKLDLFCIDCQLNQALCTVSLVDAFDISRTYINYMMTLLKFQIFSSSKEPRIWKTYDASAMTSIAKMV